MTDLTVNVPLLRKAVEWAEAEAAKPRELREWEQGFWQLRPETRADRLSVADGDDDYWDADEMAAFTKAPDCGTCYCIAGYTAALSGVEVYGWETEGIAADLLGLTDRQSCDLFDADNSIEDVRRIAESLAGERL